jgi:Mce-associated membrane protein
MAKHADTADRQLTDAPTAGQDSFTEQGPSPLDEHDEAQSEQDGPETDADDDAQTVVSSDGDVGIARTGDGAETRVRGPYSPVRLAIAAGVTAALGLGGVAGWLGYRALEARHVQVVRNELVEAARQGAVNLTTIDYTKVDADIKRILDSSTGDFRDDFQRRSQPFVVVVKEVKSKSEGTVTAAGLESQNGDQAHVLVTLSVKTSTAAAQQQEPRAWRMRISVQKTDGVAKVSNVQFVP